jgi:hypothetical protein
VPEVALDLLVKPQIKLLEASLCCVEPVYEELVKICCNYTRTVCAIIPWRCLSVGKVGLTHVLQRFPRLTVAAFTLARLRLTPRASSTSTTLHLRLQQPIICIRHQHLGVTADLDTPLG